MAMRRRRASQLAGGCARESKDGPARSASRLKLACRMTFIPLRNAGVFIKHVEDGVTSWRPRAATVQSSARRQPTVCSRIATGSSRCLLDLANRQAKFSNLAAMKYPSIHAALHRMFDNDLDDRFEAGLDLLISGLKARIDTRS
jgi:Tetracyclin repressor-like, C-terminal domain